VKQDITTKRDIEQLVKEFYADLLTVPDVQPVFAGTNFEHHVPKIVAFWSMVLLDEEGYKTNVFDKHLHLPIQPRHFDIWLESFTKTVDRLFKGEKAELAKQRATVLTFTFKSKWSHLKGNH
jgi:hemoglobin